MIAINPLDISKKSKRAEFKILNTVMSGDWDLSPKVDYSELMFYSSFKAHLEGCPWKGTEYYNYILDGIKQGKPKWHCISEADVIRRVEGLDEIYKYMKENGYWDVDPNDRVNINICRDGKIVFGGNGRHRLTFAQLLKIPKIPVNINVMHSIWNEFVIDMEKYTESRKGKVYTDLIHPSLQHIPYHYGEERFNILKGHLPVYGTILDIGSHHGYFAQKLDKWYDVTAVECTPEYLYVLKKLKVAMNRKFKVIEKSIFKVEDLGYDVIIALNIFHHFTKKEYILKRFIKMLNRIDADMMIFQAHDIKEGQMKNAYMNLKPIEFVEFIGEHSCFNHYQQIGREGNRDIFKLTRKNNERNNNR